MTPEQLAQAIWEGGTGIRFSWQYIDPGVRALKIASARRMLAADDLLAVLMAKVKAEDDEADHAANALALVAIAKAEGTGL